MRACSRIAALLFVGSLTVGACGSENNEQPAATPDSTAPPPTSTEDDVPTTALAQSEYVETFEVVWTTIDTEFYDPDFRGVDWDDAHDRYLPRVEAAESDDEVLQAINEMLLELNVSHLGVLPPGESELIDPILTADGWLGLDIRLLGGEPVVTSVAPGSPAAEARIEPGVVVERIDGATIDEIVDAGHPMPPLHERGMRSAATMGIASRLYGDPGDIVTIAYRDAEDQPTEVTVPLVQREGQLEMIPGLPPAYTQLEISQMDDGIGYVRFDVFLVDLVQPIVEALGEMRGSPGVIIDLRGNHGGVFEARKTLVEQLFAEPTLFWTYAHRHGSDRIYVDPVDEPYTGAVVVLIDVISASSAEEFAGGLQATARATVIGERTAGRVLTAEFVQLPNGSLMIYPDAQTVVADGTVLESHGVVPDIEVTQTRADAIAGADPVLDAAIDHLRNLTT